MPLFSKNGPASVFRLNVLLKGVVEFFYPADGLAYGGKREVRVLLAHARRYLIIERLGLSFVHPTLTGTLAAVHTLVFDLLVGAIYFQIALKCLPSLALAEVARQPLHFLGYLAPVRLNMLLFGMRQELDKQLRLARRLGTHPPQDEKPLGQMRPTVKYVRFKRLLEFVVPVVESGLNQAVVQKPARRYRFFRPVALSGHMPLPEEVEPVPIVAVFLERLRGEGASGLRVRGPKLLHLCLEARIADDFLDAVVVGCIYRLRLFL